MISKGNTPDFKFGTSGALDEQIDAAAANLIRHAFKTAAKMAREQADLLQLEAEDVARRYGSEAPTDRQAARALRELADVFDRIAAGEGEK